MNLKLPKSYIKAEEMRLKMYRELGLYPNDDPKWIENTQMLIDLSGFGNEREDEEI